MAAKLDQEAANHRVHDQSDLGHDLLWAGSVPPSHANDKPKKVLPLVLSGQRLHLVQLFLFVGSLQPPGPPAEQGEASLHLHLPLFPHPHPLLCHGSPVCHSYSNSSMCSSKPCTLFSCLRKYFLGCYNSIFNSILIPCPGGGSCLVCCFIYSWRTDWSQVIVAFSRHVKLHHSQAFCFTGS